MENKNREMISIKGNPFKFQHCMMACEIFGDKTFFHINLAFSHFSMASIKKNMYRVFITVLIFLYMNNMHIANVYTLVDKITELQQFLTVAQWGEFTNGL